METILRCSRRPSLGRFAERGPDADWLEHALFGRMTGRDWGVFVHKHFDYHLRQFRA